MVYVKKDQQNIFSDWREKMLNSNKMKAHLLNYFVGYKGFRAATEVDFFHGARADIVFVDNKNLLNEIEIKVDLTDLKNDFKKSKHKLKEYHANRFYFAIPIYLFNEAESIILSHDKKFGIITVDEHECLWRIGRTKPFTCDIVKKADIINQDNIYDINIKRFTRRVYTDLMSIYERFYLRGIEDFSMSCENCKANINNSCGLGFRTRRVDKSAGYNGYISYYFPDQKCPKPLTDHEYEKIKEEKK